MSLLWPFSKKYSFKMIDALAHKWSASNDVTNFISMGTSNPHDQFDINLFAPTVPTVFEDRKYQIMKGYDEYLSKRFGNYMKLPPMNQRVQAHDLIAYVNE